MDSEDYKWLDQTAHPTVRRLDLGRWQFCCSPNQSWYLSLFQMFSLTKECKSFSHPCNREKRSQLVRVTRAVSCLRSMTAAKKPEDFYLASWRKVTIIPELFSHTRQTKMCCEKTTTAFTAVTAVSAPGPPGPQELQSLGPSSFWRQALLRKTCSISQVGTLFSFCRSSGTVLFHLIHVLTSISNMTPQKRVFKAAPLLLKQSILQIHSG